MVHLLEGSDLRGHVRALESDVGSFVAHLVAVIWRTKHREYLSSLLVLEAFWFDFVTPYE